MMAIISRLLVLATGVLLAFPANAAQFACSDGNATCLIASINSANQRSGNNTILLGPGVYRLTTIDNTVNGNTTLPIIVRNIKIRATSDIEPTIIENDTGGGNNSSRIFFVSNLGNLTLNGIVLQNTLAETDLIHNLGTTSIRNGIVTGIRIRSLGGTSAVRNFGRLVISHSIIQFNRGEHGGGGAITNESAGFTSIEHSTIADNINFTGAIVNRGSLSINKSALVHNSTDLAISGGAISNDGGIVEILSSTITGNSASLGGAVSNNLGTVSLINSTVAENTGVFGGAISNFGGLVRLQNTIVANNIDMSPLVGDARPDCNGDIQSLGNNIIGDVTRCNINLQPSDHVGDPGLGALIGDDDENTPPGEVYYPLLAGSPAINAGNKKACPKKDQLGNKRVERCDIGAIEFQNRALLN